jgi:membrane-associated phospholipid phosphatase
MHFRLSAEHSRGRLCHTEEHSRGRLCHSLFWAIGTSVYFMLIYNGTNWLASRRAHVPSIHFGWESRIPFVPAMIVPYMSIDLFFFASPFLCRGRRELRTHGLRLLLAMNIAAVFFVLFPFRMAFTQPNVGGVYGFLFDVLGGFDKPFNQVPSLHIALLTILWAIYSRHTRGPLRWVVHTWAALIAVSTLLTYQHHFIDIVTGFGLGWLCLYLVPERIIAAPGVPVPTIRGRLAQTGRVLLLLAGVGLLWLWPRTIRHSDSIRFLTDSDVQYSVSTSPHALDFQRTTPVRRFVEAHDPEQPVAGLSFSTYGYGQQRRYGWSDDPPNATNSPGAFQPEASVLELVVHSVTEQTGPAPKLNPLFCFGWNSTRVAQPLPPDYVQSAQRRYTSIMLPLWFIAAIVFLPYLVWLRNSLRGRHRLRRGLCLQCGYDLRASSAVCPECGNVIALSLSLSAPH